MSVTVDNLDMPPNVVIVSPPNGSTVTGPLTVLIDASDTEDATGSLDIVWRVDEGGWQPAAYNSITGYYEDLWDPTGGGSGGHVIEASATDSASNTSTDSNSVTVDLNDPPVASFTATCDGLTCDFDASGSTDPDGTIGSYDWDFGDGNTGSGVTPSHTYAAAGNYNVELTVTDDEGATGSEAQVVTPAATQATMHVGDLQDEREKNKNKWTASVIISVHDADHTAVAGATVTGTWSSGATGTSQCTTVGSGICLVSYGGLLAKVGSVDFRVDQVSHDTLTYVQADNHDADGDSDGTTITVYLEPPANQPPQASFVYSCNDRLCSFDASGSVDPDGTIVSYAWNFGDDNSGSGILVDHTYAAEGNYPVTLTVTDNGGAEGSDSQTVSLGGATAPTMFVFDITMSGKRGGPNATATAVVTIYDTEGNPVEGATVSGAWSVDYSGSASGITLADGTVTFASGKARKTDAAFTFTVGSVTKDGWVYDDSLNVDTSDTVDVP